jgi:hypothetical protein
MSGIVLPTTGFNIKNTVNGREIFDPIRRKFVSFTPEELVRQGAISYLLSRKRIPQKSISVEKQIKVAGITKRYDVVVYKPDASIFLIVECKAPTVKISQDVFDQIARYNLVLKADYLMVSNGDQNICCTMDYKQQQFNFISDIPAFNI